MNERQKKEQGKGERGGDRRGSDYFQIIRLLPFPLFPYSPVSPFWRGFYV
jgi:hypothetical protein